MPDTSDHPRTGAAGQSDAAVIRVMLVESDPVLLHTLHRCLADDARFQLVAEAADGDHAVGCDTVFDLAVVDQSIAGLGALGTVSRLHQRRPAPTVVILASEDTPRWRHAALAEGAVGLLVKAGDLSDLGDRLIDLREGPTAS